MEDIGLIIIVSLASIVTLLIAAYFVWTTRLRRSRYDYPCVYVAAISYVAVTLI